MKTKFVVVCLVLATTGCGSAEGSSEIKENGEPLAQSQAALSPRAPRDFNGDGRSDVLWLNGAGSARYLSTMNAGSFSTASVAPTPSAGWRVLGIADFTGDGLADILWHHDGGANSIWPMQNGAPTRFVVLPTTGSTWQLVGTGDFDGDGRPDILWHDNGGQVSIWLMNGTQPRQFTLTNLTPSREWRVLDTGDFDGDGKTDILWGLTTPQGQLQTSVWLMNGNTVRQNGVSPLPSSDWSFTGTGDFDGDGKTDILWTNYASHIFSIWPMNGVQPRAFWVTSRSPDPGMFVSDIGDFNGDGRADLLLADSVRINGNTLAVPSRTSTWLMNGPTVASVSSQAAPPANGDCVNDWKSPWGCTVIQ